VLEALAAGRPVISAPVGQARDVLPPECLFRSVAEAVEMLAGHARSSALAEPCATAAGRAGVSHGRESLRAALLEAYGGLPEGPCGAAEALRCSWSMLAGRVRRPDGAVHRGVDGLRAEVKRRAAQVPGAPGLVEFPMDGDLAALVDTATVIAAARSA
jgi:hypothetical protein